MKKMFILSLLLVLALAAGCSQYKSTDDSLYQFSTIEALMEGLYDGDMTLNIVENHGDMGIGTFNGLNGEMIMIDGKCYRADATGKIHEMSGGARIPWCLVTKFDANIEKGTGEITSFKMFQDYIDSLLPTTNYMLAIQATGVFDFIKVRSVPRQQPPYKRLAEVIEKDQQVFERYQIRGTIVGYRMPAYLDGVTVPGYHLHFISEDRDFGGHLLDMRGHDLVVGIDYSNQFHLVLPGSKKFQELSLDGDTSTELYTVEKGE
jgi:acetolactate decarboxylase